MAIRKLCLYGDPVLKQRCDEVAITPTIEIKENVIDLVDSLQFYEGAGLAANQIGISKRIIVIHNVIHTHIKGVGYVDALVMVNPVIKVYSKEQTYLEEGCLSVPGIFEKVKRSENIKGDYYNVDGERQTFSFKGDESRVVQHEIDHLDGKLFIEHLNDLKRVQLKDELVKILRNKNHDKM